MNCRHAGSPPAPRPAAPAISYGGRESVRRLVLFSLVFSVFGLFSPLAGKAESTIAAPAASAPASLATGASFVGATQDPIAAWSCRGVYHAVGRGETIYSIARRYGTTAYRIAVCNGLASYTVYVGQILLVPTARS